MAFGTLLALWKIVSLLLNVLFFAGHLPFREMNALRDRLNPPVLSDCRAALRRQSLVPLRKVQPGASRGREEHCVSRGGMLRELELFQIT